MLDIPAASILFQPSGGVRRDPFLPARVGAAILERNKLLPQAIEDIASKAQVRLCARYRRLVRAGKPTNVVCVAIARELDAFVWAIATNDAVGSIA
jgi:hypothetical protein